MPIRFRFHTALALAFIAGSPAAVAHIVIDQLDRRVTVPDEVRRVLALQHQSLDIVVELGATDRLVGLLRSWRSHDRLPPLRSEAFMAANTDTMGRDGNRGPCFE